MKKFLKLKLPPSAQELPPPEIDAAILAAAALKARSLQFRKKVWKALPAIGITATAAAAAIFVFLPADSGIQHSASVISPENQAQNTTVASVGSKKMPKVERASVARQNLPDDDMLKLGDTTELEQENFNMAMMSDFPSDLDNFSI